eukprot:SAG31_NODE_288_length_18400_cov_55.018851_2_plen_554_part_00
MRDRDRGALHVRVKRGENVGLAAGSHRCSRAVASSHKPRPEPNRHIAGHDSNGILWREWRNWGQVSQPSNRCRDRRPGAAAGGRDRKMGGAMLGRVPEQQLSYATDRLQFQLQRGGVPAGHHSAYQGCKPERIHSLLPQLHVYVCRTLPKRTDSALYILEVPLCASFSLSRFIPRHLSVVVGICLAGWLSLCLYVPPSLYISVCRRLFISLAPWQFGSLPLCISAFLWLGLNSSPRLDVFLIQCLCIIACADDFPYYNLTAAFAAADLHVRDVNGQVVGMQNDNGMLHIPIFDFSKPLAVTMFIDFHRRLIASGLVDGTFADKPNERAFQKNGSWYICENPNGPPPRHSWAQACGEISAATAAAYNAGKEKMLNQLVQLYGKKGALWPVCSDGVEQCGSVCSRHAPCTLNLGSSTHEEKHAQLVQILQNYSYVYFMQGDSHGTGMVCGCSAADIIHFLLIIEEGMVIGCNGRDDSTKHAVPPQSWWSSKLGQPVGPPQTVGHRVIRSFASGVRVWYDLVAKSGSIDGWEPLPSTNREDDDAWVARNLGVEQEK